VDEAVADKVVKYCTMLRAWKIHIYHSTVIGHFEQLVSGTELGKKLERPDGSWDILKLRNNEEAAAKNPKAQDDRVGSPGKGSSAGAARRKNLVRPSTAAGPPPPRSRRVGNPGGAPPPNGTAVAAPLGVNQM
jgi:hypothetical protein